VRGLNSWPSAYTFLKGRQIKIWDADVAADPGEDCGSKEPGTVVSVDKESIMVQTGSGGLRILSLQPEGKKRMSAHDFLLGYKVECGEVFG